MIENAYIISLLALSVALFAMGLLCLFLRVYDNPKLAAYRRASKAVAFTYLFFGVINILECLERQSSDTYDNALLFRMVTLVIASAQAFFFMFAMISLINTKYMSPRRTRREFAFVAAFIVAGIVSYIVMDESVTSTFAYFYTVYYFSQLIRYTLRFRKLYRHCLLEMENYFSENEEDRLRWIFFSFHSALGIGLIALVFALLPYALFGLIIALSCLVFYVFFAIHFVNYAFIFNFLENVILEEPEEDGDESLPVSFEAKSAAALKRQINRWVADKRYCQAGVTIRDLADNLNTNTTYLSRYINKYEGKTFRNWIGALRIEEAQRLMRENPSCKIDAIADSIGYGNKSAFLVQFAKHTNMTPGEWRRQM
ncbi:MAG: helix-turn-helix domain-containing protein [Tannerella sp.]|jgi:AraC-like DNA-binding protein|nr:helix-turn-helix domain-containing protein [Tannerella sp.]